MLFSEETVRANVRNREGKRVFYLSKGDRLTSAARDWLSRERIEILPADQARPDRYRLPGGGYLEEKPEHMTHLNREFLVPKNHPRIQFRGKMDALEAELLLFPRENRALADALSQVLDLAREILRCDVLDQPLSPRNLWGLSQEELRRHSHFPQEYYGQPHFMPDFSDKNTVLRLNRLRCAAREAELIAVTAFSDPDGVPTRPDILQALNRMSSLLYILMIREKAAP